MNPVLSLYGRMTRSLRYSVTFWYVTSFSIVIIIFGVVLYRMFSEDLERASRYGLLKNAELVHASVSSFWKAKRTVSEKAPGNWYNAPADSLEEVVHRGYFSGFITDWEDKSGLNEAFPFYITDVSGTAMVSNDIFDHMNWNHPLKRFKTLPIRPDIWEFRLGNEHYAAVIFPVREKSKILYYVITMVSVEREHASREKMVWWFIVLIPSIIAVMAGLGWALISQAMLPIDRMIQQVRLIDENHLNQRIEHPQTGDEIDRLGSTFNRLLDRIEESFRRVRKFSAAASHELRTPLTAMRGELEVVLKRKRTPEEYEEVLRSHLESVIDMAGMVKELLALAKTEASEKMLNMENVDVAELLQKVKKEWKPLTYAKNVQLDVLAGKRIWIEGDKRLLQRLLANLLDNALKHTRSGGGIAVRSTETDGQVCLTVRDTGPGIPENQLQHIYERFFSKNAEDARADSTGLGLGLCRWIAEVHKGRIEVSSILGEGTIFSVWLPIKTLPTS